MAPQNHNRRTWSNHRPMTVGLLSALLLIGGLAVWSVKANISGAVIGKGAIEMSTVMTTLQHPIGGVVKEIIADSGDRVAAGDIVVRLDDWQLRSDLKVVEGDLFEALANIARLTAVIDERTKLELHPLLAEAAATRPAIAAIVGRNTRQLAAHYDTLETERRLLDEQKKQIESQLAGLQSQLAAKQDEKLVLGQELTKARGLEKKRLIKASEMFSLEKQNVAVRGELGKLKANMAELRGKISELELKRHLVVPNALEKAVEELSKLRPERTRQLERRASLLDSLGKLDIRAPVSGKIHDSRVQGLRSVVVAASPLMMIVPDGEPVIVNVRIFSTDIDQVHVGQDASLKFSAFNRRRIPIILGQVSQISADAFLDPTTRKSYYDVEIILMDNEMEKLGGRDLLPGMPVEAFLSTESRTPLNYVLKPLMSYFDRAFRDA